MNTEHPAPQANPAREAEGVGRRYSEQSEYRRPPRKVIANDGQGIGTASVQKVYIPYRFLAMLAIALAVVFALLAWLKHSHPAENSLDKLESSNVTTEQSKPAKTGQTKSSSAPTTHQASLATVCVYNNTNQQGLASKIKNQLHSEGNPVGEADNYTGNGIFHKNTVLYSKGHEEQAKKIASTLNGVALPKPSSSSLCGDGIAVVVAQ